MHALSDIKSCSIRLKDYRTWPLVRRENICADAPEDLKCTFLVGTSASFFDGLFRPETRTLALVLQSIADSHRLTKSLCSKLQKILGQLCYVHFADCWGNA
jgi:hypothetical protein